MSRRVAALLAVLGVLALVTGATGVAVAAPSWKFAGAPDANVRGFAVHPSDPKTVYAAARNDGVWVSRDGGSTWARSNQGLDYIAAWAVSIDPRNPQIVWAATEVGGAYRSADGGRSWHATRSGAQDAPADYRLRVPPVASSTELLRPFTATGSTTEGMQEDLAPDKANRGGVWGYLIDQCLSAQEQTGTSEKCAERADWAPGGYHYRDPDVDASKPGNQPGAPYQPVLTHYQFTSDIVATKSGAMFTAFRGGNSRIGGGFFASKNHGATWAMALRGPEGQRLVFQSRVTNTGANIWRVRVAPSNPDVVYLASTGGVWRSTDGGAHWPMSATGHGGTIPHSLEGAVSADTRGLAVDPKNPDVVYAGTWGAGVRVSRDGGASWTDSSAGLPERSGIWHLSFDPLDAKHMFASVYWHGVYESRDSGATWTALNGGFDTDTKRQVYAVERSPDGTLYAGTINGVWKIAAATAPTKVKGVTRSRPLPHTGLGDVALIVGGAVLVVVAAGIAWAARAR